MQVPDDVHLKICVNTQLGRGGFYIDRSFEIAYNICMYVQMDYDNIKALSQTHTNLYSSVYFVSVDSTPEGNVYLYIHIYVCDFRALNCPFQNAGLQTYGYHTRGLKGLRVGDYTYFSFTFLTVHSVLRLTGWMWFW